MPQVEGLEWVSALADRLGVVLLLILAAVGGLRRWWVYGWSYDVLAQERDYWRDLALAGTDLASRAIDRRRPGAG